MLLNIQEIYELAKFAGLVINEEKSVKELETELVLTEDKLVYFSEYPEDGSIDITYIPEECK